MYSKTHLPSRSHPVESDVRLRFIYVPRQPTRLARYADILPEPACARWAAHRRSSRTVTTQAPHAPVTRRVASVRTRSVPVVSPALRRPLRGLPAPFPATLPPQGGPERVVGNGSGKWWLRLAGGGDTTGAPAQAARFPGGSPLPSAPPRGRWSRDASGWRGTPLARAVLCCGRGQSRCAPGGQITCTGRPLARAAVTTSAVPP
jgi:hypothetical protein